MEVNMSKSNRIREQYLYGTSAPKFNDTHKTLIQEDEKELLHYKQKKEKAQRTRKVISYKLKLVGNILCLFIGCLFIMGQYASITYNQKEIKKLKSELKEIQNSNMLLKSEIAETVDLTYIKEVATEKLGMMEPAAHQIVYIEIPKVSYTAYNQLEQDQNRLNQSTEDEVVAASFFDFFKLKR